MTGGPRRGDRTRLTHTGRGGTRHHGVVNPPIYQASTVTFPDVATLKEAMRTPDRFVTYGRRGTPTTFALQDAIAALEGAGSTLLVPSGLAAITVALLASVGPGDHLLVVDSAYAPARTFCDTTLKQLGVEVTYYDPHIGAGIDGLFRRNTRAVFLESPGSITFEVQDVPAIAAVARARGAVSLIDNTWATPLFFKPLLLGVDVSIQAVTKYIGGHADLMMGAITASEPMLSKLRHWVYSMGLCAGPQDMYLALRGIRTLSARLAQHQQTAMQLATWLSQRPEVERVLYPPLPSDPGHRLWKSDFTGGSGLFGVLLKPFADNAVAAFIDGLELFGIGYSWGGFESLIVPQDPRQIRTAVPWQASGPLVRIHAGLEDPDDLRADLEAGLGRLKKS